MADGELLRCLVCSMDMSPWSLTDRETHLNACLDAASVEPRYDCPTCGQELSDVDERQWMQHVNLCLDRTENNGKRQSNTQQQEVVADEFVAASAEEDEENEEEETELTQVQVMVEEDEQQFSDYDSESECDYVCKICGFDMSEIDLMRRIRHVKLCGQKFGVRPEDMGEVEQADAIGARLEKKNEQEQAPNAFSIMMQSSTGEAETPAAGIERSNVFDVLMRGSKTAAVLNARKRPVPFKFTRKAIQRRRLLYPDFKCIQGTNPPFIVDGFQYACKENSSIYFLTHFHSDHYGGLSKTFDCGIIYCNEITAKLVVQELGVQSKYVHPVGMNTPVMVADVQVTFMDANHCPGSTIILFRLKDGKTYLHTGDFRFHRKMLDYHALQPHIPTGNETIDHNGKIVGLQRLDGVYLDTTYCDPKYTFPTQQVAVDHALELVDKHLKQEKVLFLFGSYTIGKERLFMEVARKFQMKVCVSKAKLKIIDTFGWPAEEMRLLTTEPAATNLHVVRMQDLQMDNLTVLLGKHRLRFRRIVAFRPTGWTFSGKNPRSVSTCCTDPSGKIHVYGIPYSEHSSFAELCDFVQVVNPHSIIPTVNCSSKRKATNQVNSLRQVAFHNISVLFKQQQKEIKKQLKDLKDEQKQYQNEIQAQDGVHTNSDGGHPAEDSSPHIGAGFFTSELAAPVLDVDSCISYAMGSRGRAVDSQVLSLDSNETSRSTSSAGSSRPNTSGGRSKKPKLSEFRQYLEKEELPLFIETRYGVRRVTWTANLEQLDFAHFLPICLSGLQEKMEPYPSFAFDAVMGLLESGRRDSRVLKTLPQVVQQLKSALGTRKKAVVHRVLLVLQQLAVCDGVGAALADYYRSILPLCNILQDKHLGTGDSATKELVTETLETIEAYGRDDAHLMIQQYVPAFQSCCGA